MSQTATVMLVEDNEQLRESLGWLLGTAGVQCKSYASPDQILAEYDPDLPGCLVLDLKLPGMNGLELWGALVKKNCVHPFIMISGHGDIGTAVQSMHEGAVEFLEKPFERHRFLDSVQRAIARDASNREIRQEVAKTQLRIDSLTPREQQVLELVTEGSLTKQIAKRLKISEKTVEVHRSHVTRKMETHSVAQLVRLMSEHQSRSRHLGIE